MPAWAVNQLYWRDRATYDRLIGAAAARRAAHGKMLSGKGGDINAAEEAHATAVRKAMDAIRTLMSKSGQEMTPATTQAVHDTLQALPGSATPGRLTKPLKLAGFEALAGLVPASAPVLRGLSSQPPPAPAVPRTRSAEDKSPAAAKREADEKKRAEAERRRQRTELQASLREARQDATKATSAVAAARRELERAKDERDRLQDQLQFAIKKIDDATTGLREREHALTRAEQERDRLDMKLAALDDSE